MLKCKEIYEFLFQKQKKFLEETNFDRHLTDDKITRYANIYAVRHTAEVWRNQYDKKYQNLHQGKTL